jgi:hypothetical protein
MTSAPHLTGLGLSSAEPPAIRPIHRRPNRVVLHTRSPRTGRCDLSVEREVNNVVIRATTSDPWSPCNWGRGTSDCEREWHSGWGVSDARRVWWPRGDDPLELTHH